jgi:cytochrome c peroxidase
MDGKGRKAHGVGLASLPAVTDASYYQNGHADPAQVELGRMLYFDKELSGNRNISCATCHHTLTGTGDGLALPIGEGGHGLGITRNTGVGADAVPERVPRNGPSVFNLGAHEFSALFHDGRVAINPDQTSGFDSPVGADLPLGLETPLAVQAMFPVTSGAEMAGQPGENEVADAAALGYLAGPDGVWMLLAKRLSAIPEYVALFQAAYGDVNGPEDISFVHAANAIGAFEATALRADDSPFDRFLRGDRNAISKEAVRGGRLFYGKAACADCHSGPFQTDQAYHAIAMPQIGPGKGDGDTGHEDFGREQVTGDWADRYKFRTPSLRNVELTGPWGHDGAFNSLEAVVQHHLDPVSSLNSYDVSQAALPSRPDLDAEDFVVMSPPGAVDAIASANELETIELSERELEQLMAFLHALTDPASLDLRELVPMRVPSGLMLADVGYMGLPVLGLPVSAHATLARSGLAWAAAFGANDTCLAANGPHSPSLIWPISKVCLVAAK